VEYRTLKWVGSVDGMLELIDQRKLPAEFVKLQCRDTGQLFDAIKTLAVRGAPAIGVAAAYGLVLALKQPGLDDVHKGLGVLKQAADYLGSSRPTAVNLFRALERVRRRGEAFAAENPAAGPAELRKVVLAEAHAICRQDEQMCRQIGLNGEMLITNGAAVLTHCNAGALATAGQGTALSVMFEAHKKGKKFKCYADETRPLLQGARLTAWELKQAGIDVTVICDNMAGMLMKQGKVDMVITGADRIAANGDAANKIGTYALSVLAKWHSIPFYIAAPSSTFDLTIETGGQIPIEYRPADEVRFCAGTQTAPQNVKIYNPAFDVTPAENITCIITEKGIIHKPDNGKIRVHLAGSDVA